MHSSVSNITITHEKQAATQAMVKVWPRALKGKRDKKSSGNGNACIFISQMENLY
jgi:hypothetical protein